MFVVYTRLTDVDFGKYNLPPDWRYEEVSNYYMGKSYIRFFGPDEWTDDAKEAVFMKFSELKNEYIISEFRIRDKIEDC